MNASLAALAPVSALLALSQKAMASLRSTLTSVWTAVLAHPFALLKLPRLSNQIITFKAELRLRLNKFREKYYEL